MPSWPFTRSLLYPLTAVLVALAVLPVGLAGWAFVSSNREEIEILEKQYLTRQAVGLARELEMFFVGTIGRIETVAPALRPVGQSSIETAIALRSLEELVRTNRSLLLLRLLDRDGKGPFVQVRSLAPEASQAIDVALGEAFAENLQGRPVRRDVIRLPGEVPLALVSLPLATEQGLAAGALQALVSLQEVGSRLAEESSRGVTVDVVDPQGHVLFSSATNRVGRDASAHPLVAQFLQAPVRLTTTYSDPLGEDAGQVLGSLCPIGDPPWAVVTARDVDIAFATVREMRNRTALLAVITGICAMAAGGLLARRITAPLRSLADVTTSVARGDFARRVPVSSRNELGQLAENFNQMSVEIERYVGSLRNALRENQELMVDSIRALAAAIDAKNPYTRGHSERVSQYAAAIAKHMGIQGVELRKLEIAALLHDVGKIGIEDAILTKPDALTEAEFAQMKSHTVKGAAIISPMKRLREVLPAIRSHHENWSGGGYPDGLVAEQIPIMARIIATADVFDAMTTHRPYQRAMSLETVFVRMRELAGKRLDPAAVEAFFAAIRTGDLIPLGQAEVA